MSAFVYVCESESWSDFIKIGMTTDTEKRLKTLNNSSVQHPVNYLYKIEVEDKESAEKLEHILHYAFENERGRKEFFKTQPSKVLEVLNNISYPKIIQIEIREDVVSRMPLVLMQAPRVA